MLSFALVVFIIHISHKPHETPLFCFFHTIITVYFHNHFTVNYLLLQHKAHCSTAVSSVYDGRHIHCSTTAVHAADGRRTITQST